MSAAGSEHPQPGGGTLFPEPGPESPPAGTCPTLPAAAGRSSGDSNPTTGTDTLFYDGQCPLCASEINRLRETRGDELCLVDIHDLDTVPGDALQGRPGKDRLLRALHLQRADGSWLTGADANVAAWENTAHERRLRPLRWPLLRHLVDVAYALWARWRYWRLYGAQFDESRHAPDQAGH